MQKARRFTCSTVSQSSPSNSSVRTRKKSRASSAGGDSARVRSSAGGAVEIKRKSRNVSIRSTSSKPKRKVPRPPCRVARPNVGNLQSTVVLAPFYTLKKSFQNKLVDMYAHEKSKKLNRKAQRGKKKNMSFEYDIIELRPSEGQKVKKEGRSSKKPRPKSRSSSYCQCHRVPGKERGKSAESSSKQKRKASSREEVSPRASTYSEQSGPKRRKLHLGLGVPVSLKYEPGHGHPFDAPNNSLHEGNQGFEVLSARSKCDSWETYSNSASCKEEHVQGSLAISTTSFDSYLEHFDKGNWDYSESNKCNSRTHQQPPTNGDLFPKSTAKNLIVERNNSDGEIIDFMDREPQTRIIPSSGSYRQWQPLRRQSKTKQKKPETDSAATGYYLRSCSKEKDVLGRTYLPINRQECKPNWFKTILVEVGTQVEDIDQCPTFSDSHVDSPQDSPHILMQQIQEEPSCDVQLPCQKMKSASRELVGDPEPPQEEEQQQQQPEYFEAQGEDTGLGLLGERSDVSSMQLMAGFSERFQGPTDPHQPQDKEFIFGPRNSGSGLGESCEFSFGLKWALSDDED